MHLPKTYNPNEYEGDIYALWEKSGAFQPTDKSDKSYSIVVPPPNANGSLHIGQALTLSLQDVAIRYHRMRGENTVYIPGADHAGFETQVVYEKFLVKNDQSRFDFSREELYAQIWDFVAQNRETFNSQFRRIGASVDWQRFVFTLDTKVVDRAYKTFKKLWDDGLIYRGERLVNFCTFHGTAFADVEVEHSEEKGSLWHIRYPLSDGSGELVVATTRPETIFGDTAVAVHPDDKRYQKYVGKTVRLPLTKRDIPVIADTFVDPAFGTGAVKITPAHDPNDYEAGERHDLPKITVIDDEGKLNSNVPDIFRGLTVSEGRAATVTALEDFLVNTEAITHNVGHCYKCGTVIQPLLRDQWFIDMQPLALPAIAALKDNRVTFYPEAKKLQLINYLENLRDWNISRQIAWGIPIPAYQNIDEPDDWIFSPDVQEALLQKDGKTYKRDPDVFDTWFSSSSWPYATLDYPDGELFNDFYPLSLLETGGEILYPWVSRMLMLGLYVTGEVPFKAVYLHGYVMAQDGAKMSKSLGNVINPVEIIDEYGADALRMGIISGRVAAVNRGYDPAKVLGARNFCNKLWNIARFITDKLDDGYLPASPKTASIADEWMMTKLHHCAQTMQTALDEYRFSDAYDALYECVWNEFADWYIEASKATPNIDLLTYALTTLLKLAHPFAPFVTETIWQNLDWAEEDMVITAGWPAPVAGDAVQSAEFDTIKGLIGESRAALSAMGIRTIALNYADEPAIANNEALVKQLGHFSEIGQGREGLALTTVNAWLAIDADQLNSYRADLETKLAMANKAIAQLEGRLANASYAEQAPAHIVQQSRDQLAETKQQAGTYSQQLAKLS